MARTIDGTFRVFVIERRYADEPTCNRTDHSEEVPIPAISDILLARDFCRLEYVVDTTHVKITCEDYPEPEGKPERPLPDSDRVIVSYFARGGNVFTSITSPHSAHGKMAVPDGEGRLVFHHEHRFNNPNRSQGISASHFTRDYRYSYDVRRTWVVRLHIEDDKTDVSGSGHSIRQAYKRAWQAWRVYQRGYVHVTIDERVLADEQAREINRKEMSH